MKLSIREHTFRNGARAIIFEVVCVWYQNIRTHGIALFFDHITVSIGNGYKEYYFRGNK